MKNTSSCGFSTGPHCQDLPAALFGIQDPGGLAAIFAGLLYMVLQAKVQVTLHANLDALRLCITSEWDQLAAEYICKALPLISDTADTLAVAEKMKLKLNRQPTAQNTATTTF